VFPWLRLFRVGLMLLGQPRVDIFATTRVRVRVWPNDLDFNLHVNNGRYLMLADLGRIHWFFRTGVMAVGRRKQALPVVGDALAKFRRELKLFQVFEIHTRLLGWDQRWAFLEHRFVRNGRVLGVVAIRGVFKGANGAVPPGELAAELMYLRDSPPLPAWTTQFHQGADQLSEVLREEERSSSASYKAQTDQEPAKKARVRRTPHRR
jgi:acyl-CoA thioesterase FadM